MSQQGSQISAAVLVGAASFVATLLLAWLPRRHKSLSYDVVCVARVAPVPKGQSSNKDKGTKPPSCKIFVIDLHNASGRLFGTDIASSQYEREISFSFGDRARVVEVDVMKEDPSGIGAEASIAGSHQEKLGLAPVLLNRGDWLRLKAVVENPTNHIIAEARILGIKKLKRSWDGLQLVSYGVIGVFLFSLLADSLPRWVGWFITGDMLWMLRFPALYGAWLGVILAGLVSGITMIISGLSKLKRSQKLAKELSTTHHTSTPGR